MNKDDIIRELDALKLKIMLDEDLPSDVKRFEDWIDKLQLRGKYAAEPFSRNPVRCYDYARYQTIRNLVDDLYGKKNEGYNYHKNRPEIRKQIAEIVAMTLFVIDENGNRLREYEKCPLCNQKLLPIIPEVKK